MNLDAAFFRAARAYVRRVRALSKPYGTGHHLLAQRRRLVPPFMHEPLIEGQCVWCKKPITEDEIRATRDEGWMGPNVFHLKCMVIYFAARDRTHIGRGHNRTVPKTPCVQCGGKAQTLDHRIPLAVASRMGHAVWLRAWWIGNLQWLCKDCNERKDTSDQKLVGALYRMAMNRDYNWHSGRRSKAFRALESDYAILMWVKEHPGETVEEVAFQSRRALFTPYIDAFKAARIRYVLRLNKRGFVELRTDEEGDERCYLTEGGRGAIESADERLARRWHKSQLRRQRLAAPSTSQRPTTH